MTSNLIKPQPKYIPLNFCYFKTQKTARWPSLFVIRLLWVYVKIRLAPSLAAGVPMSDSQSTDKGDRQLALPENQALKSKDALAAQNAGIADISAVEKIRTNASNGSLQKYAGLPSKKEVWSCGLPAGGSGAVVAARVLEKAAPITEATKSSVSMQELLQEPGLVICRQKLLCIKCGRRQLCHQVKAKNYSRLQKSADDVYGNQPRTHKSTGPMHQTISTLKLPEDLAPVSEVARSA